MAGMPGPVAEVGGIASLRGGGLVLKWMMRVKINAETQENDESSRLEAVM
jgi:hypothetical protein